MSHINLDQSQGMTMYINKTFMITSANSELQSVLFLVNLKHNTIYT